MYASLLIVHILPFLLYDSLAKETNILEYVYVVPHEPEWYSYKNYIQLRAKQTASLVNNHYQNVVTLTGQSPPLKCYQPFEILTQFITGLDLLMIEIWGLWVKGLQSCWPSNFENGSTPVQLESGPIGLTRAGAVWQTFSWDRQFWKLLTLQPFNFQTPYLQKKKI